MQYRPSYHAALNYLIAASLEEFCERGARGRVLIARALCDLRRQHGATRAASERRHMLFIRGSMPLKAPAP
jgi:hypothetical protein